MSTLHEKFKQLPAERKALSLFVFLGVLAMIAAWYDTTPTPTATPRMMAPAPPISGTDVPKQNTPLKTGTVKTIPKKKVSTTVDLPAEILDGGEIEVTDTAQAPPSENGTRVISTINVTTGDTRIYTQPNPPSLFAFENKRRIGVGYGLSTQGPTAKVFAEWTFLRVGSFHVSAQAELAASEARSPEAKMLAVIDYRW